MRANESRGRDVLPIPDLEPVGLTTYDAKDPDTSFPPIVPLGPRPGRPTSSSSYSTTSVSARRAPSGVPA
jgi:hypothetical protein